MHKGSEAKRTNIPPGIIAGVFSALLVLIGCIGLMLLSYPTDEPVAAQDVSIMSRFDSLVNEAMSDAYGAACLVPKQFWLEEDAAAGPVPSSDNYGRSSDPAELGWLLEDARTLLDGQSTLFSTDVTLRPGSEVTYYLDDTILAITWKQIIDDCVYTFSEIKLSHPSQFRRHILDSTFDGPKLDTPTNMAKSVNAVVGASADHYRGRRAGIIVYDAQVMRIDQQALIDVCYIDSKGDLIFSYRGQIPDKEAAQAFVDENDISFSLSFGPILVDNGVRCEPASYALGEVNDSYARAALCQMGKLHYLVVVANFEEGYWNQPDIHEFAARIESFGCEKAYTLDGGNTGSIVMDGRLINRTTFGYERTQGDLIYFCTAIPNHQE